MELDFITGAETRSAAEIENLVAERQEEYRFVAGYMTLMTCSERAARSVYMHVSFAVFSQSALIG